MVICECPTETWKNCCIAGSAGVKSTAPTEPKETRRRRIKNWGFLLDIPIRLQEEHIASQKE
jgi:hypothetical protein